MTHSKTFVLATALILGSSLPGLALTPQEEATFRQACTGDYMRFCSTFEPNSPQVNQCFQQRMKQLSPQCQSAISAYSQKEKGGGRSR